MQDLELRRVGSLRGKFSGGRFRFTVYWQEYELWGTKGGSAAREMDIRTEEREDMFDGQWDRLMAVHADYGQSCI